MVEIKSWCAILVQELYKSYIPFDFPNSRKVSIAFYTIKASESQIADITTSFSMSGSAIVPQEEKKKRTEG